MLKGRIKALARLAITSGRRLAVDQHGPQVAVVLLLYTLHVSVIHEGQLEVMFVTSNQPVVYLSFLQEPHHPLDPQGRCIDVGTRKAGFKRSKRGQNLVH